MEILRRQVLAQEKMQSFTIVCDTMHLEAQKKRIALRKLEKQHASTKVVGTAISSFLQLYLDLHSLLYQDILLQIFMYIYKNIRTYK